MNTHKHTHIPGNPEKNQGKYRPYDVKLDNITYFAGLVSIITIIILAVVKPALGFDLRNYCLPCMLHLLTGYYCPGCGGTRAAEYLISGHLLKSFHYNPIVPYLAITGGWFMISQTIYRLIKTSRPHFKPMTIKPVLIYVGVAILLIQCLVKNLILLLFSRPVI